MKTKRHKNNSLITILFYFCIIISLVAVFPGCNSSDNDSESNDNQPITNNLTEKEKNYLSPDELNELSNVTSSELTAEGFDQLNTQTSQGVLKSKSYFKLADIAKSDDSTKFFRAVTSVAALGFDIESDQSVTGAVAELQDVGDIIEAFGGTTTVGAWENMDISFPDELPASVPNSKELLDFYNDIIIPELEDSLELLNAINSSFNITWTEPVGGETVESDYGDVLFGKAILEANLGIFNFFNAHNLEIDYNDIQKFENEQTTIEQFFNDNPSLLKLSSQDRMNNAKNYMTKAADDLLAAIEWMEMEMDSSDPQGDELICLCDIDPDEIDEAKIAIAEVKNSITNGQLLIISDEGEDSTEINLQPLFVGLNLRGLLPNFSENEPIGFFPDPTFGGVLAMIEGMTPGEVLGEDLNANGTADFFEDED